MMRGVLWLAMAVCMVLPPAAASTAVVVNTTLPQWSVPAAAIFDGQVFWVFWTDSVPSTHVHRYDPVTDTLTTPALTIPGVVQDAVWANGTALVLTRDGASARFHRFDPSGPSYTSLSPYGPAQQTENVFWDGQYAYVLVLHGAPHNLLRYDPATDAWVTLGYGLGPGNQDSRLGGAVVWNGQVAYALAKGYSWPEAGKVFRIDPAAGTVTLVSTAIPAYRRTAPAVWMQGQVFDFSENRTYIFDEATQAVSLDPTPLPIYARESVAAKSSACEAYIFGATPSADPNEIVGNNIVRYSIAGTSTCPSGNFTCANCGGNTTGNTTGNATGNGGTSNCTSCQPSGNPSGGTSDGARCRNNCERDYDLDGSLNYEDNCRYMANHDQADADGDGIGDACDPRWDPAPAPEPQPHDGQLNPGGNATSDLAGVDPIPEEHLPAAPEVGPTIRPAPPQSALAPAPAPAQAPGPGPLLGLLAIAGLAGARRRQS